MPAALTTISGAPKNDAARSAVARSAAPFERSAVRVAARAPTASISRCALSAAALFGRPAQPRRPPRPARLQSRARCQSSRRSPGRRVRPGRSAPARSRLDARAELEALAGKILCEPIVGGARVRFHSFQPRDARGGGAMVVVRRARHALPRHRLDEFVHRQSARVARCAARGQARDSDPEALSPNATVVSSPRKSEP